MNIQSIQETALEPEVRDYIEGMIQSALDDGDVDEEAVLDTLNEFLTEDETNEIKSQIRRAFADHTPVTISDCPTLLSLKNSSPLSSPETSSHTPHYDITTHQTIKELNLNPNNSTKPKSKIHRRKEARLAKKQNKNSKSPSRDIPRNKELVNDDHESAWKECQESNRLWGGRGHGGRGIRISGDNFEAIHLPSVSLCYEGNELLVDSTMDIIKGHRYGLLGRNGCGKSTLLSQIAAGGIPGLPHGLRVRMVKQQQVEGRDDQTTLQALVEADEYRTALLKEQERIEDEMDRGLDMEGNAQRLGEVAVELDVVDADNAEIRAEEILKGLSFTKQMIQSATSTLSGGWRMRLALAQAIFVPCDVLLLDECTNHLDLYGMTWLENYLTRDRSQGSLTLICVSHDRNFLDAICTDMVVMEHKRLTYHAGNYSQYRLKMQEKAARESQILDAAERQRSKAMEFVQKQQHQAKKSIDPNKQRQAKMIKDKKLDRIGNYREDGKRYKLKSLKKLSEDHVRLAQKVEIEVDEPVVKLKFPNPSWPPSITEGSPVIRLEDLSFTYDVPNNSDSKFLLRHVTLSLTKSSKIAVVGANGSGKTSLLELLSGQLNPSQGTIWRHPNIRTRNVSQYSVEELEKYSDMTVVQYAEEKVLAGAAASDVIAKASGNVRQYLGAFGLGGSHAHKPIGMLSGGERMRLCFATVLADQPHVLLLDEATNHIDLETLDSLAEALRAFKGVIVMVSHNQGFLSGFCNELWVLDEKTATLQVSQSDTESFDDLFDEYRHNVLSSKRGASDRQRARQTKASLAKRAATQRANTSTNTALL
jgi:ATP-binding cassette subfamily F protein 3